MTNNSPKAFQISGRRTGAALALVFFGFPVALPAATTLQQLLATIDAHPMLAFGGIYLNYSEILAFDAQATTLVVDGSVIIAHSAEVTTTEHASTPGTGPIGETTDADLALPLRISTAVTGGSNQGSVSVEHSYSASPPVNGQGGWLDLPGEGLLAVNAASTQAQVTGSVTMLSYDASPPVAKITTSAVGASNYGSISIVLRNGARGSEP